MRVQIGIDVGIVHARSETEPPLEVPLRAQIANEERGEILLGNILRGEKCRVGRARGKSSDEPRHGLFDILPIDRWNVQAIGVGGENLFVDDLPQTRCQRGFSECAVRCVETTTEDQLHARFEIDVGKCDGALINDGHDFVSQLRRSGSEAEDEKEHPTEHATIVAEAP